MTAPRTVGIIGGMGPGATCTFFERIIRRTPAARDREHLHVIINSDPSVPDRTEALLGRAESPVPHLVRSARLLEAAGARLLAMPCVTAHAFIGDVRKEIDVPLLSIVEETARAIKAGWPDVECVGIMATDGTLEAGVFGPLAESFRLVRPSEAGQHRVMAAVYGPSGVKTIGPNGEAAELLTRAAAELVESGAEAIVAGCTEIPLALTQEATSVPLIDTLDVLARAVVREAVARP